MLEGYDVLFVCEGSVFSVSADDSRTLVHAGKLSRWLP